MDALKSSCPTEWRFVANRKPLMLRFTVRTVPGWSHRLAWPRTEPSQGLNTGSNPVGTTTPHFVWTGGYAAMLRFIEIEAAGKSRQPIDFHFHTKLARSADSLS